MTTKMNVNNITVKMYNVLDNMILVKILYIAI